MAYRCMQQAEACACNSVGEGKDHVLPLTFRFRQRCVQKMMKRTLREHDYHWKGGKRIGTHVYSGVSCIRWEMYSSDDSVLSTLLGGSLMLGHLCLRLLSPSRLFYVTLAESLGPLLPPLLLLQ